MTKIRSEQVFFFLLIYLQVKVSYGHESRVEFQIHAIYLHVCIMYIRYMYNTISPKSEFCGFLIVRRFSNFQHEWM